MSSRNESRDETHHDESHDSHRDEKDKSKKPKAKKVDISAKKTKEALKSKSQPDVSEAETQVDQVTKQLKEAQDQLEEAQNNTLKALAELENFKKRKDAEKEDYLKYANKNIILECLIVLDSFDHAVSHAKDHKGDEKVVDGILLIQKQFFAVLKKFGVKRMNSLGESFDPNCHQAVGKEKVKDETVNQVVREIQPGYTLHERVIRPAMVIVSH